MFEIGMQVEVTFQDENGEDEVVSAFVVAPLMPMSAWVRLKGSRITILVEQENIRVK
jgi:hypothetical protein